MKDLARMIRNAGKEIARDHIHKDYHVEYTLQGKYASDDNPCVLIVSDDSGYRSIILGDIRGNVSLDTGALTRRLNHKGYVYLYSDNHTDGKWKYPCFPPVDILEKLLHRIANGEDMPDITYYPGDNGITATKDFLAASVRKFGALAKEKYHNSGAA